MAVPHLAVALGGVAVAHRQVGPGHEHRQVEGRARHQVPGVHVPAVEVGRDGGEWAWRHPDLAAERGQRDADAGPVLDPVRTGGQGGDLVERVGNSSASRPKPGIEAVQPQSAGWKASSSIWTVPPGSAPSTATGPLTWSTRAKSSVPISAVVDSAVSWPNDASRQSNSTTLPDGTVATGIAGSQAR